MSLEELRKHVEGTKMWDRRHAKIALYDKLLEFLREHSDKNIGQLTIMVDRIGIHKQEFGRMLNSFVLSREIEIYNQGDKEFVRVLVGQRGVEEPIVFQEPSEQSE